MAKNNNLPDNAKKAEVLNNPPAKAAQKEESHGPLAFVIALVALLLIAGGMGALFLIIKAKNLYTDSLNKNSANQYSTTMPYYTGPVGTNGSGLEEAGAVPATDLTDGTTNPAGGAAGTGNTNSPGGTTDTSGGAGTTGTGGSGNTGGTGDTGDTGDTEDTEDTEDTGNNGEGNQEPAQVTAYDFDYHIDRLDSSTNSMNADRFSANNVADESLGL